MNDLIVSIEKAVFSTHLEGDKKNQSRRVRFNARLTSLFGIALFVGLAIEGLSVPFVSQLFTLHVFVGAVLIPLMAAKLIVVTYRFVQYYLERPDFREAGPPQIILRVMAPLLVISTIVMMVSGVMLMVVGPRGPSIGLWNIMHKASFVVWFFLMAIHVSAYLIRALSASVKDLRRLRSKNPNVLTNSWYRLSVLFVVLGIGVGLGYRLAAMEPAWLHYFAAISGIPG